MVWRDHDFFQRIYDEVFCDGAVVRVSMENDRRFVDWFRRRFPFDFQEQIFLLRYGFYHNRVHDVEEIADDILAKPDDVKRYLAAFSRAMVKGKDEIKCFFEVI